MAFTSAHPRGHVADRAGSQHQQGAVLRKIGVLQSLPCRGQDVGEEQEPVIGVLLGDLDRHEVSEGHAEVLRLPARDLAIELAVPEEAGAGAVLAVLGGLTLAVEPLAAHPALAATDVERYDDPVADLELRDRGTHLFDDAHGLVPDDVPGLHERRQGLVQV